MKSPSSSDSKNAFVKYILSFLDGSSTPLFLLTNPWLYKVSPWPVLKVNSAETFFEGESIVFAIAWISELSKTILSPSINSLSFIGINDIWELDNCSVKIASVPDVFPSNISPINKSLVVESEFLIYDNVNFVEYWSLLSFEY